MESTHSALAHRWGGDRFESWLNTASYLKTLKMVPIATKSYVQH